MNDLKTNGLSLMTENHDNISNSIVSKTEKKKRTTIYVKYTKCSLYSSECVCLTVCVFVVCVVWEGDLRPP